MMGSAFNATPYCGAPPAPYDLWIRWNLDPVLMACLVGALVLYGAGAGRLDGGPSRLAPWRRAAFLAGWATAAAALISPLCALSVSLFSARVGQHMILSLIAAPLVMLGCPGRAFSAWRPGAAARPARDPSTGAFPGAAGATVAFTLALWFWHAPLAYDATFASPLVYWLMHLTLFGAALMVWGALLDVSRASAVRVMAVGAVSTLQMTFLGALITLTPRLLYAPHALTTYAWGLSPASDQQLGGLIMWVPGCSIFLAVTLFALGRAMSERARPDALA